MLFPALPGGYRNNNNGNFNDLGNNANFWSATEFGASPTIYAWRRFLRESTLKVSRTDQPKKMGYSIRLVKE
ncbi:MAG TPA: hypothetical protein ENN03_03210 [bacterium]|nr:hypothetical protein [bacterium]